MILFQIKNDNFIGIKLPSGKKEVNKIIQNRDYYLLNRQKYNQTQITVSENLCIWYICIQTGDFFLKEFIWDTLTLIHVDRKYPPPFNIANSYLDFKHPGMIHIFFKKKKKKFQTASLHYFPLLKVCGSYWSPEQKINWVKIDTVDLKSKVSILWRIDHKKALWVRKMVKESFIF